MKLLLIGGGPQLEEYEKLAKELNISDTVKFTGRVEHAEIPPYYASCDCYITASLTECHSISMMEGMATGMPVLTIRDELNADQIEEGVSGYYFRNADEMYDRMKHFRSMSFEELEKFKEQARSAIVSSGAQTIAEKLLVIYEESIKEYNLKQMYKKSPRSVKKPTELSMETRCL